mgnify:FL=1
MKKYKCKRNNRVVVLCEKKTTQTATINKLQTEEQFEELKDYYLFKNLEEAEQLGPASFYDNRQNIRGEPTTFY